jgi:hypothetical protein
MTYEDVRRMGHADDYDEPVQNYKRAPARTNTVLQVGYSVSDVWAAACAAQRVNGGYFKEFVYEWDETAGMQKLAKRRNRDVMLEFLQNPDRILVDDIEAGEKLREYLEQDITFRALKGQLTDFDNSTKQCLAVKDRFYTVSNRYELAVVAALPNSARRSQERQTADQRIQFAQGGLVGKPGDQVTVNIEVIRSFYKKEFNIFFITGITDQDQVVTFGFKENFDLGTSITIRGKVKSHRDKTTQLNYAKVL